MYIVKTGSIKGLQASEIYELAQECHESNEILAVLSSINLSIMTRYDG